MDALAPSSARRDSIAASRSTSSYDLAADTTLAKSVSTRRRAASRRACCP
jgi:hypothetical protein